jgi:hypothetical protein
VSRPGERDGTIRHIDLDRGQRREVHVRGELGFQPRRSLRDRRLRGFQTKARGEDLDLD